MSAILLFAVPVAWFAWPRGATSDGSLQAEPSDAIVAPLGVQSLDSALALGWQAGARRVVFGQSRHVGDSLVVVASLHDVATGTRITQLQRAAPASADPRPLFEDLARSLVSGSEPTPAGATGVVRPNQP